MQFPHVTYFIGDIGGPNPNSYYVVYWLTRLGMLSLIGVSAGTDKLLDTYIDRVVDS